MTLRSRFGPLRSQHVFPTVRLAIRRACQSDPDAFRVVHFSVQHDHLHLLVEARNARALSSGMRSVAIRMARYVNDLLSRRGALWAERWHGRALKTPREVRNALVYVLANFRHHARRAVAAGIDPYSSAAWFDGFRGWAPGSGRAPPVAVSRGAPWVRADCGGRAPEVALGDARGRVFAGVGVAEGRIASARSCRQARAVELNAELWARPVGPARTWLLATGWRQHGLLGIGEQPRS